MLLGFIGYTLALIIYMVFSADGYDIPSRFFAWLIFLFGSLPLVIFLYRKSSSMPFIELILMAYVNAYSLPIFFESQNTLMVKTLYPESEPVLKCFLIVSLTIFSLWCGFKIAPSFLKSIKFPKIKLQCDDGKLFIFGVLLCLINILLIGHSFGDLEVLAGLMASSDLGIGIISLLYFKGNLSNKKKLFSIFILLILVVRGFSTGMTQLIMQPLVVWFVCRWLITKKLELLFVALGVVLIVLIQPVKLEYRNTVAGVAYQSNSTAQNMELFANLFYDYWLLDREENKVVESVTTRTSLLLQTAHVIDWTPDFVPFKNGDTLKFMLISWVPRIVWPDKPIAQQANIDYAIEYGVTTVEGAKTSMFGVGPIGEVFMNFGVMGIFPVFFILGIFSYVPLHVVSISRAAKLNVRNLANILPTAPTALLVSILFKFMLIGGGIADSYGGMMQLIMVQGGMLYLFTRSTKNMLPAVGRA